MGGAGDHGLGVDAVAGVVVGVELAQFQDAAVGAGDFDDAAGGVVDGDGVAAGPQVEAVDGFVVLAGRTCAPAIRGGRSEGRSHLAL